MRNVKNNIYILILIFAATAVNAGTNITLGDDNKIPEHLRLDVDPTKRKIIVAPNNIVISEKGKEGNGISLSLAYEVIYSNVVGKQKRRDTVFSIKIRNGKKGVMHKNIRVRQYDMAGYGKETGLYYLDSNEPTIIVSVKEDKGSIRYIAVYKMKGNNCETLYKTCGIDGMSVYRMGFETINTKQIFIISVKRFFGSADIYEVSGDGMKLASTELTKLYYEKYYGRLNDSIDCSNTNNCLYAYKVKAILGDAKTAVESLEKLYKEKIMRNDNKKVDDYDLVGMVKIKRLIGDLSLENGRVNEALNSYQIAGKYRNASNEVRAGLFSKLAIISNQERAMMMRNDNLRQSYLKDIFKKYLVSENNEIDNARMHQFMGDGYLRLCNIRGALREYRKAIGCIDGYKSIECINEKIQLVENKRLLLLAGLKEEITESIEDLSDL